MCIYVYVYVCGYVYVYRCICVYVYMCMCVYVYVLYMCHIKRCSRTYFSRMLGVHSRLEYHYTVFVCYYSYVLLAL